MRKLGRKKSFRESMMRNLATSLLLYEKVDTTEAKAKDLKKVIENIIIKAKKGNLTNTRYIYSHLYDKNASKKLLEEIVPRYKERNSGFVTLSRLGKRIGDNSNITRVELIEKKVFVADKKISNKTESIVRSDKTVKEKSIIEKKDEKK
jgi:large subunit ribosomal protein L17